MDIRTIPVEKINPAPYNPRIDLQPSDPEYDALKKAIEQFGYIDPLICQRLPKVSVTYSYACGF
ncbi:ParB N-terminal domain-containing protein [Bacillus subtilis]|uniref:ParB N-terminal domain-containing protein n=1 Tax=Bacillus subtilis TaxID=1423 RepID=UPI00255734EB|nr:ParB N-terminal domain-containing protein [Bacillus subtilis]MDL2030547.1 ParB N-terminal domain-containing protein [Bacillus subtilis]